MRFLSSTSGSVNKTPCCSKVGIKRGPWTPEEDEVLSNYVKREGEGRWRTLPKRAGLQRCGKSCRLRWMNYLRPSVKRGHIAPDEEDLILRLHRLLGNRWSLIAGRIPGRTDNEIKNYWNTHLSKKLISQGIDPRNHKPLNPSPAASPIGAVNNNINFVAVPAQPPPLPPHPNALTLEKASANQYQPISIVQDVRSVMDDGNQPPLSLPVVAGNGNWPQSSNPMVMGYQVNATSQDNNAGQSYLVDNFNNEDTLSSFLATLMNDNFPSPYPRWSGGAANVPLASTISPTVDFISQGAIWDADLMKSALETL
ncbi:hypothetical protein SAY87_030215 [Trapa incisa]|uniref:Uncharacterized protein n=1 Tax=Trapa incisa TaxID=236973 RepID=A0AAN7QLD3_9MYRT|nr:hypothetical protein SAY87_030215 [Trapa incisa]